MWLRDGLPQDIPQARILIYGYDTTSIGSNSIQEPDIVSARFYDILKSITMTSSSSPRRPVLFIAHSLGGIVLKYAFNFMADNQSEDTLNIKATFGVLFFGVPNREIDTGSLFAMTHGQFNMISTPENGLPRVLAEDLPILSPYQDSRIISYYETVTSPTAKVDPESGLLTLSGENGILVDRLTAFNGRSWEDDLAHWKPINRSHSDMIRFSE